jgi:integrase
VCISNKRKIKRFLPPDESTRQEDRAYTQKEIRDRLLKSDERSRVLILLMTSTGMRIGVPSSLQLGDLTRIPEYKLIDFVYGRSKRDKYYTFCTPECAAAIVSSYA